MALAIVPSMIAAASFGLIAYLGRQCDFLGLSANTLCSRHGRAGGVHRCLDWCWSWIFYGLTRRPPWFFMGDTGSLAIGGALGSIAVATKHEIVLAIIGGLFVLEALSVIVQVASFKNDRQNAFLPWRLCIIIFEQRGWAEAYHCYPFLDYRRDTGLDWSFYIEAEIR